MANITDRFKSDEEVEILNTDEFCEGEQARLSGLALKVNPDKDFQNQSSDHWAKGWCDRDMILKTVAPLLPCPFCGSEDLIFESDEIHETLIAPRCNGCGCSPGYCGSEGEAIAVWNTRHP